MIYRECYKDRGIILIDILLALTLGTLFIALIGESTFGARDLFYRAKERERLITLYETHATDFDNLLPYQSRGVSVGPRDVITGRTLWYGNDRMETVVEVTASNSPPLKDETLTFIKIKSFQRQVASDPAGTPLCSVDFSHLEIAGSFNYLIHLGPGIFSQSPLVDTVVTTSISLPLSPAIPLTDLQVRNNIAYLSTDSTSASDPDLYVFDISDAAHPRLISSLNTGPGIARLTLAGKRIFAAAASTAAQLHVVRFDAFPQVPLRGTLVLEKKFQLPLPYATATPPFGSSIFYDRHKIYLGTEKWDGEEFNVIDVTNPFDPQKLGGYETGSKINDIFVRSISSRDTAYIASADEKQLRVLDISNPSVPFLASFISPSGWQRQEGKTLSFFQDGVGLGRTSGGFNISQDHELFEWATTSVANLVSPHSVDVSGGIYGIVNDRHNIFMATRQPGKEFQWQDSSLATSSLKSVALPNSPQMMTCDNNSLFILAHDGPIIYKVNFKQP
ncbi:MAG: hypothetical protein V4481_01840 [Patescibacteria group bacterium]